MENRCSRAVQVVVTRDRPETTKLEPYEEMVYVTITQIGGDAFLKAVLTVCQKSKVSSAIPVTIRGLKDRFSSLSQQIEEISNRLKEGGLHQSEDLKIHTVRENENVLCLCIITPIPRPRVV